jgi:hypothetical protein
MPDTQPVDPRVVETVRILHGDAAADALVPR